MWKYYYSIFLMFAFQFVEIDKDVTESMEGTYINHLSHNNKGVVTWLNVK